MQVEVLASGEISYRPDRLAILMHSLVSISRQSPTLVMANFVPDRRALPWAGCIRAAGRLLDIDVDVDPSVGL